MHSGDVEDVAEREALAEIEEIMNEEEVPLTDEEFRELTIQSIRSLWRAVWFVIFLIVLVAAVLNWRLNVNMRRFGLDVYNQTKDNIRASATLVFV